MGVSCLKMLSDTDICLFPLYSKVHTQETVNPQTQGFVHSGIASTNKNRPETMLNV